jgi:hypothetical protein
MSPGEAMSRKTAVFWRLSCIGASLCILSFGCDSGQSLSNYDHVKEGMTESEVDALLGKGETESDFSVNIPSKSISVPIGGKITTPEVQSSARSKRWKSGKKVVKISFQDGKVVSKTMMDESNSATSDQ